MTTEYYPNLWAPIGADSIIIEERLEQPISYSYPEIIVLDWHFGNNKKTIDSHALENIGRVMRNTPYHQYLCMIGGGYDNKHIYNERDARNICMFTYMHENVWIVVDSINRQNTDLLLTTLLSYCRLNRRLIYHGNILTTQDVYIDYEQPLIIRGKSTIPIENVRGLIVKVPYICEYTNALKNSIVKYKNICDKHDIPFFLKSDARTPVDIGSYKTLPDELALLVISKMSGLEKHFLMDRKGKGIKNVY